MLRIEEKPTFCKVVYIPFNPVPVLGLGDNGESFGALFALQQPTLHPQLEQALVVNNKLLVHNRKLISVYM